jgi:hypothetical protein
MNTYEVTYQAISPSFRNTEIEVPADKATEIREELAKSLKARQPVVYGRDWYYDSVAVKDTMIVEGDHYSVSNNGTAHFYEGQSTAPSTSVLNVIHVRKLPTSEPLPLHLVSQMSSATGTVPSTTMKAVAQEMNKAVAKAAEDTSSKKLTWAQARKEFEDLLNILSTNPAWKRMMFQVCVAKGSERIELRPAYPTTGDYANVKAPKYESER